MSDLSLSIEQAGKAVRLLPEAWKQFLEGAITLSELNLRITEAAYEMNHAAYLMEVKTYEQT